MASLDTLPELVRDSKLRTEIEGVHTIHTRPTARRSLSKREIWTFEGIIGQGGGGVVLLQRQSEGSNVDRRRAVKRIQLNTGIGQNPMSSVRRFIRELEASAKFSQEKYEEYFVKSYGWYHTFDEIYIAMEYCEQGDLGKYLGQKGTIPENEAKDIIYQVVTALAMMHDEDFAHRDLKPSNILIVSKPPKEWWVKLCDLGLSRRSSDASGNTTIMGTPQYMAPEIIGGRFSGNPTGTVADPTNADIWCVGEILFHALTGSRTFDDETLYRYQKSLEPFPMSRLESVGISKEGIDLISSLMAPVPQDRPDARQALGHAWMPADPDSFIDYKEDSALLSSHGRPANSSVANIALFDQLTQASAQWTTTSPVSHFTGTPTQASGQWTTTMEAPPGPADSVSNKIAPIIHRQTNLRNVITLDPMNLPDLTPVTQASDDHTHNRSASNISRENDTVVVIQEDNVEGQSEKEQETVKLGDENQVDHDLLQGFRQLSPQERLRRIDRLTNRGTTELKEFSGTFKPLRPISQDFLPTPARNRQRIPQLVSKPLPQAQGFETAKNEQSPPAVSSSIHKARKDNTSPLHDRIDETKLMATKADISPATQDTHSKEPPNPMTRAQRATADKGSPEMALTSFGELARELTQSDTSSMAGSYSSAPVVKKKRKKWAVRRSIRAVWHKLFPSQETAIWGGYGSTTWSSSSYSTSRSFS